MVQRLVYAPPMSTELESRKSAKSNLLAILMRASRPRLASITDRRDAATESRSPTYWVKVRMPVHAVHGMSANPYRYPDSALTLLPRWSCYRQSGRAPRIPGSPSHDKPRPESPLPAAATGLAMLHAGVSRPWGARSLPARRLLASPRLQ